MPTFRDTAAVGTATVSTVNLTVPSTLQTNDVVLVIFTENNGDVLTGAPSSITQQDSDTATAGTWTSKLYSGVVGQNGLAASGTLTWNLSANRQCSALLCAWSGIDTTTPILGTIQRTGQVVTSSSAVIPSISPTSTAFIVEAGAGKSNGTAITTWTAPSGWTRRGQNTAGGTFAGSSFMADNNSGIVVAGTYGGETYTSDQAFGVIDRYAIALKPAASGAVTPVSVDVATGWTPSTGTNLQVVTDADGNTYTTSSTSPSGLEFDITLNPLSAVTSGQPLKVFYTMRARSATSATLNAQLYEGATQRSSLTGVAIPISSGFPITDLVTLTFPWTDVQNVVDWSALKIKIQVTAS